MTPSPRDARQDQDPRSSPQSSFVSALAALLLAAATACTSSSSGGPPGDTDSGRDLGQSVDTGAGTTCPPRPDLAAAAPTCSNVVNSATAVPFTAATGTAPTPAGGAIRDGLYESTRTEAYGDPTARGGRRITFVILGGATRMLWTGEVLNEAGTAVTTSFRGDVAISVTGTAINVTPTCVSVTPSPFPAAFDYTVSNDNLVLSLASGTTVAATTYTRRGCAP